MNGLRIKGLTGGAGPLAAGLAGALPALLTVVLLVALGIIAARLTWTLWFAPGGQPAEVASANLAATKTDSPMALSAQLAALAPFGRARTPANDQPEQGPIQASHLAIRLEGVISGTAKPLAIIRVGARVKVFQVGERVTGNARLHAVEPRRVVLDNNGRLEYVDLPHSPGNPLGGQPPSASALSSGSDEGDVSVSGLPPVRQFLSHPQKLLDYVSFSPARRNGKAYGYRLVAKPGQADLLSRLGLSSGDILTRIDGMPLDDPSVLARVLPLLRSGQPVRASVMHGGKPTEVMIDLSNIR